MNTCHLSQKSLNCFALFDVDDLEIADCSGKALFVTYLGDLGQVLIIRLCHEDVIFTRKSHNCAGTAFVQGNSAGGSKLTEQTLIPATCYSSMQSYREGRLIYK